MGELDENDSPKSETQQNNKKPNESDKTLDVEEDAAKISVPADKNDTVLKTGKIIASLSPDPNTSEIEDEIEASGEEITHFPWVLSTQKSSVTEKNENCETTSKKIPIINIKMRGFLTKEMPKRYNVDESKGELLQHECNDNKTDFEKQKDSESIFVNNIRNLILRKPSKNCEKCEFQEAQQTKGLRKPIKFLPFVPMIPKTKTGRNEDVELGIGPEPKAGLASMETLDDSLKDHDTVDRATKARKDEPLKTVKLSDKKKEEEEQRLTFLERVRMYKCLVDDLAIVAGIVIFILLVGVICVFSLSGKDLLKTAPLRNGRSVTVVTNCGPVEGLKDDGSFTFRGIPYAKPPVGENRWKHAQLIDDITDCWNGTLQAYNATPVCSQILSNGSVVGQEDCLRLDIVTPHIRYDNSLPVIVLIGAESLLGGSPTVLRPSARYARLKEVIYVRPNFRLGPFGFLALDVLRKSAYPPTSGNYGLSDILAALKWIQRNIVHFGGNPKLVILLGHKAGGTLVSTLVTSPLIKDLYARAWAASGASIYPGKPLFESERLNYEYITQIQCDNIYCLRNASVERILEAVPDTWRYSTPDLPVQEENSTARHEWLVLDGKILQNHPADVWSKEFGKPILVLGTTAHESHSEKLQMKNINWTAENVHKHIEQSKLGTLGLTNEVVRRYNATYASLAAIISDIRTICPMLTVARLQPAVPLYVVTQTEPQSYVSDSDADVQAIMGRYEPHTAQQRRFFSAIQQLFYHWVAHGEMQQYDPRQRVLIVEQDAVSLENYSNCDFWISQDIVPRYGRVD